MAGENVFDEAFSTVQSVDEIVHLRIEDASATAAQLQTVALGTIEDLQKVNFYFDPGQLPEPPNIDPTIEVNIDLGEITPTSFGSITSQLPDKPRLNTPGVIPDLVIPEFESSIASLNIPEAPAPADLGAVPSRPITGTVDIPAAPITTLPPLPFLVEIDIPVFGGITIPMFDAESPEFAATALPGILQWSEPEYYPVILDEVMDKIRLLWSGGSGIPEAVERAMVERAMDREDLIASRAIADVAEEFSLRGFTMPSGMQAARVDSLRQELTIKKLGANRELTIKFAEFQIENVRFGVQQAIAAENVFVNLFLNSAARLFEAAKYQIESQINIYNAQVALYSARMNGYQIEAQVFKVRMEAELAKIEVFKAEIEAEIARGQINEQKVRTYTAQVQALQVEVEIYKAKMTGANVQAEVIRSQIEAYKTDVQAYGERVQADKLRYDAYESRVKGEVAKAGIIDAEARAYAALIQGKSAMADIAVKRVETVIQTNRVLIEGYVAELEAEKARLLSQTSVIQAGASAYTADTQRFAAVAQAETTKAQAIVSAKEAELRTNVSFYQAKVQAYIGNMEQLIRKASLVVDALKAAGQISSTLAAGAMAGVHVGATLSGSGAVSASGGQSYVNSVSTSTSTSKNYNFEGTGNE